MTYDPYSPRTTMPPKKAKTRKAQRTEEVGGAAVSGDQETGQVGNIARDQLRSYVERIERLTEEKSEIADDIKAVFGEAKAVGFDPKVMRRVIAIRKQDPAERAEFESVLDTYLNALGMQLDLPGVE